MDADLAGALKTPFTEQEAFFKRKLSLPTEWWDDIHSEAHDRAFVVAGAMKADLLDDLRQAVDKAIAKGTGFKAFQEGFAEIVKKLGWYDYTGDFEWRTRVIYGTNLRASYAAGRYAQMTQPDAIKAMPYWRYKHCDSVLHPRELHLAWNGLTLKWDDAWWATHYPPNGYGCKCRVVPVAARFVKQPHVAPDNGTYEWVDPSGVTRQIPSGVDPGWGYAPGANAKTPLLEIIDRKLMNLEAPIGAAMMDSLEPILTAEQRTAEFQKWAAEVLASKRTGNAFKIVGNLDEGLVTKMADRGVSPASAEIAIRDEDVLHAHRDTKKGALPWAWYLDLPLHLTDPRAVILDTTDPAAPALLYVFDLPDAVGKLVLKLDYLVEIKSADGIRRKTQMNILRSGREIKDIQALNQPDHEILEGGLG